MSWQKLLKERRVKPHETSPQELKGLRAVIERDLADASLPGLSADRRFATAYNAVLQISKMVIACVGFRVAGLGHHQMTFEVIELAMGPKVSDLADYFDACRRKRNLVDYDMADVATQTEADELLSQAKRFRDMAEAWIAEHYPELSPEADKKG